MIKVGDTLKIIHVHMDYLFNREAGKIGKVTHIDEHGYIHGTWSNLVLVPEVDAFIKIEKP